MEGLTPIRESIQNRIGSSIYILPRRGRRKENAVKGILENAYGNVFTVLDESQTPQLRVSYTYSDVLTHAVDVSFPETE